MTVLGIEQSIDNLGRTAQQTGDIVAQSFARAALQAIAEWKKANAALIDQAFDRLDESSKGMFRELNDTSEKLNKGEQVTFVDLQKGIAAAGTALSQVVGSDRNPQVAFSWPSVFLPSGEGRVTIHIIGSRIADANSVLTFKNQKIDYKRISDNELTADLERSELPKDDKSRSQGSLDLDWRVSVAKWWNPFSWWSTEPRHRDIEFSVLPRVPGHVYVDWKIETQSWDTRSLGPIPISGNGKDNTDPLPYLIPKPDRDDGWILDQKAQKDAEWQGGDGEGGSRCLGYDVNSFSDTGFNFSVWHGHNTDWAGHKSNADQHCYIWVKLKKKQIIDKLQSGTVDLNWLEDIDVLASKNTIDYKVRYSLFTGSVRSFSDQSQVPYDLFQIYREKESFKFRPRPQRDF